jgi:hypothetical protein
MIMVFGNNNNNHTDGVKSPFYFIDYDKISDVILRFDMNYFMKLNVRLSKKDKDGNRIPFHSEYKTYSKVKGYDLYTIRREYNVFYSIESSNKEIQNNYVNLYPNDVYILNMLINNNILPWFFGDTRIFGKDGSDLLFIKYKDYEKVYLPLTGGQFLSFLPTIINYMDDTSKEGLIIGINREDVNFEISVDKFFYFAYIIANTDMFSMAAAMIDYVKHKPYLVNYRDISTF